MTEQAQATAGLLLVPISYRLPWSRFGNADDWQRAEVVATKFNGENPVKWAVREGACVLNKDGEWEYEPMPSSRDDDFLSRTRYSTAEEAADTARKAMEAK